MSCIHGPREVSEGEEAKCYCLHVHFLRFRLPLSVTATMTSTCQFLRVLAWRLCACRCEVGVLRLTRAQTRALAFVQQQFPFIPSSLGANTMTSRVIPDSHIFSSKCSRIPSHSLPKCSDCRRQCYAILISVTAATNAAMLTCKHIIYIIYSKALCLCASLHSRIKSRSMWTQTTKTKIENDKLLYFFRHFYWKKMLFQWRTWFAMCSSSIELVEHEAARRTYTLHQMGSSKHIHRRLLLFCHYLFIPSIDAKAASAYNMIKMSTVASDT